jgi:hypothetical protein
MQLIHIDPDLKKKLTSLNFALGGWRTARELLAEIQRRQLTPDFGMFEGLMVGACVLYVRPFKKARGLVPLAELESFSDQKDEHYFAGVHQAALDARDCVLAHQDVSKWPTLLNGVHVARAPDEIFLTVLPDLQMTIECGTLLPQGNLHELLPELVELQIRRVDNLRLNLVAGLLPPRFPLPARIQII